MYIAHHRQRTLPICP